MNYIIGLGNPGKQYETTRHNVGRLYLEQYAVSAGFDWTMSKKAQAYYAHTMIADSAVECVLPETFMNRSGETVAYIKKKHDASPSDFIVLHDDIDLPLGQIKISKGRGDGGNNGIKSIIQHLGSKDFVRVRIGIASRHWWTGEVKRPQGGGPLQKHVLGRFSRRELNQLEEVFDRVQQAIETIVTDGVEASMNRWN